MSSLVVRGLSPELHRQLKNEAARHHRSMNREIIAILEEALHGNRPGDLPAPVKGKKLADGQSIVRVIREARDGRQ